MNGEEVGAIGHVLGPIAVFITLGYLAVEARYARGEVRRAASQDRWDAQRDLLLARVASSQMSRPKFGWHTRTNAIQYIDELSRAERDQLNRLLRNLYGKEGNSPAVRLWYEAVKGTLNADVVRYVDNLLAQPG